MIGMAEQVQGMKLEHFRAAGYSSAELYALLSALALPRISKSSPRICATD
jgi:hypothetical protein